LRFRVRPRAPWNGAWATNSHAGIESIDLPIRSHIDCPPHWFVGKDNFEHPERLTPDRTSRSVFLTWKDCKISCLIRPAALAG